MGETLHQLWEILGPKERKKILFVVVALIFTALLDVVGIGALLPIVGLMQKPSLMYENRYLAYVWEGFGRPREHVFFIVISVLFLALFVAKNCFVFAQQYLTFKFVAGEQSRLMNRLLSGYLNRPYTFYFQVNTADLIRNVTGEVNNVVHQGLVQAVTLASEGLLMSAILALIIIVNPEASLYFLVPVAGIIFLFHRSLRLRTSQIGEDAQRLAGDLIRTTQESLGAIKEIKVLVRERFFEQVFSRHAARYEVVSRKVLLFNALPRLVLESLFILMFVGILITQTLRGHLAVARNLRRIGISADPKHEQDHKRHDRITDRCSVN